MRLGIVGGGRMGGKMALRLLRAGHEVVIHDIDPAALEPVVVEGGIPAASLTGLVEALSAPRTVWVMVPHGPLTDGVVAALAQSLQPGDTLIDGGNSNFKSTISRAELLCERGIEMLDVGTSGGVHGLERGYCLMIGGDGAAVERNAPIFAALAPGSGSIERTPARLRGNVGQDTAEEGWLHCGASGAGHYVKMIHNGIEYGMMQAFAEGFALLESAGSGKLPENRRFDIDCAAVAELWRRGSVVTSWLLDLTADSLGETPDLAPYSAQVADSGEGRWTVETAVEQSIAAPVLTAALYERFRSRTNDGFGDKLLSAMRYKFGGHTAPQT